jgi:hypothetical protein
MSASAMGPPMIPKPAAERRHPHPPDARQLARDVVVLLRKGHVRLARAMTGQLPAAIEAEVERAVAFGWLQGFADPEKSHRR